MTRPTMNQLRALRDPDRRPRMNGQKYAQVVALLCQEPHTVLQMHAKIGCAKATIKTFFTELKRRRLIHIAEWVDYRSKSYPLWVPAYSFGTKADVRRPPKADPAERCKAWRQRKKQPELDKLLGLNSGITPAIRQNEADSAV